VEGIHSIDSPSQSRISWGSRYSAKQILLDVEPEISGCRLLASLFFGVAGDCIKSPFIYAADVTFPNRVERDTKPETLRPTLRIQKIPTLAECYREKPSTSFNYEYGSSRGNLSQFASINVVLKKAGPTRQLYLATLNIKIANLVSTRSYWVRVQTTFPFQD